MPDYLLASITEFGAATADYEEILRDLKIRQEQRAKRGFDCRHSYAAMLGSTDLIEISRFDHYFHLSAVGGSSAQAFRRSVGVRCPLEKNLPEKRNSVICTISDALEKMPDRPLLAVMYLKLSAIPALCLPFQPEQPLLQQLFEHVCSSPQLWQDFRQVLDMTVEANGILPPPPEIKVAPLLGLDSVELALVVRASCFEQMAALAFAIRHQRLDRYWPATDNEEAVRLAARLVPPDLAPIATHWDQSPLFGDTTSVVGMPLRRNGERWNMEALDSEDTLAAGAATVFKQSKLLAGTNPPDPPDLKINPERHDRWKKPPKAKLDFLMLFDRTDVLSFSSDGARRTAKKEKAEYQAPLRPVRIGEIRRHLGFLIHRDAAGNKKPPENRGVRTALRVAVRTLVPSPVKAAMPTNELLIAFHSQLRAQREKHLDRDSENGLWTKRWLDGTKAAGTIYPVTNSGVNLIASVLDYLEDDLEGFIDLLPVLDLLVEMAYEKRRNPNNGKHLPTQSEIIWFYKQAETLAASRGRRDHPMRLPQGTLSFEGHAGYRTSRDAFYAFLEAFADEGGHKGLILLQDSSGDGISCRPGRRHSNAVRASAMVLHHPFYWGIFAHELAHGSFQHTQIRSLATQEPLYRACEALKTRINLEIEAGDTVESLLLEAQRFLHNNYRWIHKQSSPLSHSIGRALDEVLADLLLWDALKDAFNPNRRRREFWFLAGPTTLFDLQHQYGSAGPNCQAIQNLFLRWFLVDRLLEGTLGAASVEGAKPWFEDLQDLLSDLWDNPVPPAGFDPESLRGPDEPNGASLVRFWCLREDLSISMNTWLSAIGGLLDAFKENLDRDSLLMDQLNHLVEDWIRLTQAFRSRVAVNRKSTPAAPRTSDSPRAAYSDYISALAEIWKHARPWLPFVSSHKIGKKARTSFRWQLTVSTTKVAISRRGGVLSQGADQEAYNTLTLNLIAHLNDYARARRSHKLEDYLEGRSARAIAALNEGTNRVANA